MWVWLKLKLTPKGDFCEDSVTAFFLQISLCTALSDTWMSIFSYFPSQTTEVRPKSANDEHPRHFCMGSPPGEADHHLFHLIFRKVHDYHLLRVLALLHFRLRWMTAFMMRSDGVLTFVYFYQLGKTGWTSTLYFLVTFTDVARFEINVETLLFACANFFIREFKIRSLRTTDYVWTWESKPRVDWADYAKRARKLECCLTLRSWQRLRTTAALGKDRKSVV